MFKKRLKVVSLEYSLEIIGNSLKVGCQTVTREDALTIAEFINQANFEEPICFTREEAKKVMKATGCYMQAVNWSHKSPSYRLFYDPKSPNSNKEGFIYSTGYSMKPAVGSLNNYDMFEVVK